MPSAFSRILLAYDGSAGSRIALEYACALAHAGATLTVAHAVDEVRVIASAMTASGYAAVDPTPLINAVDDAGAAILQSAVAACATHGISAERVFLHDSARTGVAELERDDAVDLIVLGTHGRHGIARAILGSVAEEIIRSSQVPVLVVTGHAKSPRHDQIFARALVGLDDSEPAQAALSVAGRLATRSGTQLTLCNVIDSRDLLAKASTYGYDARPFETDLHAVSRTLLEKARAASGLGTSLDDLADVEGEPAEAIEHTAMQRNCDLIILGSHLRRGLDRLVFGSVAEGVIRSSSLPVLVVPGRAP